MADLSTVVANLLQEIGESVEIYYEPRNEGMEWMVALARVPLLHEHFAALDEGLQWLAKNKPRFAEWEAQIERATSGT